MRKELSQNYQALWRGCLAVRRQGRKRKAGNLLQYGYGDEYAGNVKKIEEECKFKRLAFGFEI